MTLVIGTNSGFCNSQPSGDPDGGGSYAMDTFCVVNGDTSPATATRITEIGWYCNVATEEADFDVALYADDGGVPGDLLLSSTGHAKGTDAGWKRVTGLTWSISSNTVYWLAVRLNNTTTDTSIDREASGGYGYDRVSATSSLPDPYDGGALTDSNGITAIYALWDTGGAAGTNLKINIWDDWKTIAGVQINIGDSWRAVEGLQINIGDAWKTIF